MQAVLTQIHRANMKALLLSRMNVIIVVLNVIAMVMLIVTWAVSVSKEKTVMARFTACIIAFILLAVTMALSMAVQQAQPKLSLFYAHQVLAALTLVVMGIAMGMNDVMVNVCHITNPKPKVIACDSHIAELVAELIVCLMMMACYVSTQQRVVTFIDKGILDGIKGRSNGGMTNLP